MQTELATKRVAREYELVYILQPNTSPEDAERVATRVQETVAKMAGKITKVDAWGRRKLAYPIGKATRGVFLYVKFVAFNDLVPELERHLRNSDVVMRFQTIRREGVFDLDDVAVDPEEAKFTPIEGPPADEEPEPTFEERLGLTARPSRERHDDFMHDEMGDDDDMSDADASDDDSSN